MKYIDRDLSWLAFNGRIIQEVASGNVPLMERLKFVAIFSSNLEEFYKVRVASHRFAQKYKGDKRNKYGYRPSFILQQINNIVSEQQAKLGQLFYDKIVKEMAVEGIHFLCGDIEGDDVKLIEDYFDKHLQGHITLLDITDKDSLDLKNQAIYHYIVASDKHYLLELDYKKWGRFITLSQSDDETRIIQLDDICRNNIHKIVGE
ncbi:MAG: hypothetical protein N4A74_04760, partial [Carboxylicivirga sp.]|nr:hypothetical protein [Carboxylicivirga sp.]